jgi:hypothetical protein
MWFANFCETENWRVMISFRYIQSYEHVLGQSRSDTLKDEALAASGQACKASTWSVNFTKAAGQK